jgi:hypothetical protein
MLKRNKQVSKEMAEKIKEFLSYDSQTGIIRWKKSAARRIKVGYRAGCTHPNGHIEIYVAGRKFMAHHLAWLLYYGEMPDCLVFHSNGKKSDNSIQNLTMSQSATYN